LDPLLVANEPHYRCGTIDACRVASAQRESPPTLPAKRCTTSGPASGQYERDDGAIVHGDASGEWTLDEKGEVEDIVFFASPHLMGYGHKEKAE
jgi:hypothetical protein